MQNVVAIVPLKALEHAKQRLSPQLDAAARRELAGWMLAQVVRACQGAQHIARVLVVAGDEAGMQLGVTLGAEAMLVSEPGLQQALDLADLHVLGASASIIVAADLPLALPEDLDAVVAAASAAVPVVVAPTVDGGTGALFRCPPSVIGTAYGPNSASAHAALAERAGITAVRLEIPRLSIDIDTPEQLAAHRHRFPAGLPGS